MGAGIRVVLAICVFLVTHNTWPQSVPQLVEKPEFRVGDRWVFERVDLWTKAVDWKTEVVVTDIKGDRVWKRETYLENSSNPNRVGQIVRNIIHDGNMNTRAPGRMLFTPVWFEFPLWIGKTWKSDITSNSPVGVTRYSGEVKVAGWEKQRIGSKDYDVIKLEFRGYWFMDEPQGTGRHEYDYWYAPELRAIAHLNRRDHHPDNRVYWQWSEILVSAEVGALNK